MASRVKRIGVCKRCFCAVGRDASGKLVHQRTLKETCGGTGLGFTAELR